jgi:Flp pilus assembly protein TadG
MRARSIAEDRRAQVAVEFAAVGSLLLLASLGIVYLGLISWTKCALQAVANEAARCGALALSNCSSSAAIQSYVQQTLAPPWVLNSTLASNLTVNVNGSVSTAICSTISGGTVSFETVELSSSYFSNVPYFGNYPITVCASYPIPSYSSG